MQAVAMMRLPAAVVAAVALKVWIAQILRPWLQLQLQLACLQTLC